MGKSLQALLMAGTGQFECSTRLRGKKSLSKERDIETWDILTYVHTSFKITSCSVIFLSSMAQHHSIR